MSKFNITWGKGFQMMFENGYVISVQFGTRNYCSRKDYNAPFDAEKKEDLWSSNNAEIAVWKHKGGLLNIVPHDQVIGWLSTDDVLHWMNKVANATCDEDLKVECTDEECWCEG
jgi:hypothetical protein